MVALIEEQIHRSLIAQEERRCLELEEKYKLNKETRGNKVKRKTILKPWTRPGKETLCQESDLLKYINEYDYDLSNNDFQEYCSARGVLDVAGKIETKRWELFLKYKKNKEFFLSDPFFRYAEEFDGKKYRFSDEQLEIQWEIVLLGRAKIQDCWEIFSGKPHSMEK